MSKPKQGSKLVQLRLPSDLHDLLRHVAASDRRSIANLVTVIVAERLGYEKSTKVSAEGADTGFKEDGMKNKNIVVFKCPECGSRYTTGEVSAKPLTSPIVFKCAKCAKED